MFKVGSITVILFFFMEKLNGLDHTLRWLSTIKGQFLTKIKNSGYKCSLKTGEYVGENLIPVFYSLSLLLAIVSTEV